MSIIRLAKVNRVTAAFRNLNLAEREEFYAQTGLLPDDGRVRALEAELEQKRETISRQLDEKDSERRLRIAGEVELARVSSIHHPDCGFLQGLGKAQCDCALESSWLAQAYRGAAARAEKAEAEVGRLAADLQEAERLLLATVAGKYTGATVGLLRDIGHDKPPAKPKEG